MADLKKLNLSDLRQILDEKPEGGRAKGAAKLKDDGSVELIGVTMQKLREDVAQDMKPVLSEVIVKTTDEEFTKLREGVDESVARLEELAQQVRPIQIQQGRKKRKLDGIQHAQFDKLLRTVAAGLPAYLVGPAGTGKTHGAEQVAKALDLAFYSISVGSQTSKSDLQGYMTATGDYIRTQFREAYENGGLFLLDEADAGNSNVLILLNAALSNGYMAFPDGMIKRHDDFRMVATANTFGHGASRQYVGRNQLDAATLDRFVNIAWNIDDRVEAALAGTHKVWLNVVRAVRTKAVEELELRVVVSPRATQRGAALLEAGEPFESVLDMALLGNVTSGKEILVKTATDTWEKGNR